MNHAVALTGGAQQASDLTSPPELAPIPELCLMPERDCRPDATLL